MKILALGGALDHEGTKQAFARLENDEDDQIYLDDSDLTDKQLSQIDILLGIKPGVLDRFFRLQESRLKWIQAYSAGVDYFPLAELEKRGILLSNVSGIHAEPIAETVLGLMLSQFRGLNCATINQLKSTWQPASSSYALLSGKTLVVFGTGHIGERVAELGKAFKMNVVGVNHSGHPVAAFSKTIAINDNEDPSLVNADVIVNALPLTKETTAFYDSQFFNRLESAPMFINIGRGPSVQTADLLAAVKTGKLGSAALDVTDPEPLPADDPLWQTPHVTITPHVSGMYHEYSSDVIRIFQQNLRQFKKDGTLARNQVDLDKGY